MQEAGELPTQWRFLRWIAGCSSVGVQLNKAERKRFLKCLS